MQRINLPAFYHTGEALVNFKRVVKRDAKLVPIWNTVFQARAVLAKFMEVTSELSFTHSRESAERLIASIEEYKKELSAYLSDHEKTLDLGWVLKVEKQLNEFEILFERESEKINAFSVSKKGIYDTEALIERAHESLPLSVVSRLSKETIEDINQAGRCLALDSPTAAGFHILRAVESLIRIYHEKLTKKALALKSRNWGSYIRDLNDASADQRITGYLLHMKDTYRNPIAHPDVILSVEEAFSLFNASLSAITQLDAAIQSCP